MDVLGKVGSGDCGNIAVLQLELFQALGKLAAAALSEFRQDRRLLDETPQRFEAAVNGHRPAS